MIPAWLVGVALGMAAITSLQSWIIPKRYRLLRTLPKILLAVVYFGYELFDTSTALRQEVSRGLLILWSLSDIGVWWLINKSPSTEWIRDVQTFEDEYLANKNENQRLRSLLAAHGIPPDFTPPELRE
jgi:hypothetical protein